MAPRRRIADPNQFLLPLGDEPEGNGSVNPWDRDSVLFAVMPDPAIASRLPSFAMEQRHRYGLTGWPRPVGRLHLSLIGLGKHKDLPAQFIERAKEAASTVRMRAFVLTLNQMISFENEGNHPLVLRGDDGVVGLTHLYDSLGAALVSARLIRHVPLGFTPHLTLLYDRKRVSRVVLDAPFEWTVNEFVLVHGRHRARRYDCLRRWPLDG
jgi:2'-5' RNA ligase